MSSEKSASVTTRKRKLIEVAFPLEEVSAHSRREKNIRHGHISTLHIWWARRPLAACRAFIYASLVDDPDTDDERDALLKEIADLASWDAVRHPDRVVRAKSSGGSGLTGHALLQRAKTRILASNGGVPPRLLDPFAGGGAIPLEGIRLGCDVEASDLNPVAVLILKATVEYPQKYGIPLATQIDQSGRGERTATAGVDGRVPDYIRLASKDDPSSFAEADALEDYERNPLAADVLYWGSWILERARVELADLYPAESDSAIPVAYLWSRTVPCPNCGAEMPLLRQYWLVNKDRRKVALEPIIDQDQMRVDFRVTEGTKVQGNPTKATTSRGDTACLVCSQIVKADGIREFGRAGQLGERMLAVVVTSPSSTGKRYREANESDLKTFAIARARAEKLQSEQIGDLPAIPDEPLAYHPKNMMVREYGLDTWGKLFNARQLVAMAKLTRLVRLAHVEMLRSGVDSDYAAAVAVYLAFVVDKVANRGSTSSTWDAGYEKIVSGLSLQSVPMKWDYAEANPIADGSGGFQGSLEGIVEVIVANSFGTPAAVTIKDAREVRTHVSLVVTDPPYYDAINYADLSDFFYVWLIRSLGDVFPEIFRTPLTPKKSEMIMNVYTDGDKVSARERYVEGMGQSFSAISQSLAGSGSAGIVFAHTAADAWATLIEGLLAADLVADASWPIDTEMQSGLKTTGQARLKTSVWMSCLPRRTEAATSFLADVLSELRPIVREKLLHFWSQGIRGADFFISAIGPALSVFGRYEQVLRPDGSAVSVRDFLDLVRREATAVALEQVLGGADLGVMDPISSQYLTWAWSYGRSALDPGEAIALCLATGADYRDVVQASSIATEVREKSKKFARLRTIRERAREDEDFGRANGARPTPLIDQLQHAAALWGDTRPGDIALYRAEIGEQRWGALRTLGQAVAECLPEGDEDRRLINGLLSSAAMGMQAPRATVEATARQERARQMAMEDLD